MYVRTSEPKCSLSARYRVECTRWPPRSREIGQKDGRLDGWQWTTPTQDRHKTLEYTRLHVTLTFEVSALRHNPLSTFLPLSFASRGMAILGIGVDICHIPRIARLASRERFAQRILSPAEARLFGGLEGKTRERFLAVRYVLLFVLT